MRKIKLFSFGPQSEASDEAGQRKIDYWFYNNPSICDVKVEGVTTLGKLPEYLLVISYEELDSSETEEEEEGQW